MNRLAGYLVRFAVIILGYAVASLAASAFINIVFLATAGFRPEDAPWLTAGSLIFSIPFVALFVAYFVFLPAGVFILVAEALRRRDWLFYALGGGVIGGVFIAFVRGAADPDFFVADIDVVLTIVGGGIVGGWFYWLSAGRWAGSWHGGDGGRDKTISPEPSGS